MYNTENIIQEKCINAIQFTLKIQIHNRSPVLEIDLDRDPRTKKYTRDRSSHPVHLRQVARGKPRLKAVVSTMGKLAEITYHCLRNGEFYQYQGKYRIG